MNDMRLWMRLCEGSTEVLLEGRDSPQALMLFKMWFENSSRMASDEVAFLRDFATNHFAPITSIPPLYRTLKWNQPTKEGDFVTIKPWGSLSSWSPSIEAVEHYAINYLNDVASLIIVEHPKVPPANVIFISSAVITWVEALQHADMSQGEQRVLAALDSVLGQYEWQQEYVVEFSQPITVEVVHAGSFLDTEDEE